MRALTIRLLAGVTLIAACAAACSTKSASSCNDETDQALCARLSRDCDLLTASDVCGITRTVNCGTCTPPMSCGGGGTANLCGLGDSGPTPDSSASGDSASGDSASTDDAPSVPDGCSFTCPTRAHWITGTFTITYANPPLTGSVIPVDGKFQPLQNEIISFVVSFDEGAKTKVPPSNNQYTLDIVLSQADIAYRGDSTGILDKYVKLAVAGSSGNGLFSYSANESVDFGLGTSSIGISFRCKNLTLPVGPDQYIVPGDVSCGAGSMQIQEGIQQHVANFANGTGSFVYH